MPNITPAGIDVFVGKDPAGESYIGMLIDQDDSDAEPGYRAAPATPERIRHFRRGIMEVRTLPPEVLDGRWYLTSSDPEFGRPMKLELQDRPLYASRLLPATRPPFTDLHRNGNPPALPKPNKEKEPPKCPNRN